MTNIDSHRGKKYFVKIIVEKIFCKRSFSMKGIKRADIGDMEHANSDRYEKRHVVIFDKQNVGEFLLLEKDRGRVF